MFVRLENVLQIRMYIAIMVMYTSSFSLDELLYEGYIVPKQYQSIKVYDNRHIGLNVLGAEYKIGSFVTRSNVISSNLIYDDNVLLSYDALIQLPLVLGANFNSYPTKKDIAYLVIINALNGEFGYKYGSSEVGVRNSFNFYFSRRVYHKSELYYSFGYNKYISLSAYVQDRVNSKKANYGICLSVARSLKGKFL